LHWITKSWKLDIEFIVASSQAATLDAYYHLLSTTEREISQMKTTMMKTAALVLSIGLLAGCASGDKMTKMESDIANATATAEAAMKAAKQAQLDAASAQGTADSAMSAANAAQAAADQCSERCSRMSEKAFAK
jgi:hypothetical protein